MVNLRIMRVFFFLLLLASMEVQARILQEGSHNSMVERNNGFSGPKMSSSSTLKNSPGDVLLMINFFRSLYPPSAESFWKKFDALAPVEKRPFPAPPSPRVAPPHHNGHGHFGGNYEAALPYESPPNPFRSSG